MLCSPSHPCSSCSRAGSEVGEGERGRSVLAGGRRAEAKGIHCRHLYQPAAHRTTPLLPCARTHRFSPPGGSPDPAAQRARPRHGRRRRGQEARGRSARPKEQRELLQCPDAHRRAVSAGAVAALAGLLVSPAASADAGATTSPSWLVDFLGEAVSRSAKEHCASLLASLGLHGGDKVLAGGGGMLAERVAAGWSSASDRLARSAPWPSGTSEKRIKGIMVPFTPKEHFSSWIWFHEVSIQCIGNLFTQSTARSLKCRNPPWGGHFGEATFHRGKMAFFSSVADDANARISSIPTCAALPPWRSETLAAFGGRFIRDSFFPFARDFNHDRGLFFPSSPLSSRRCSWRGGQSCTRSSSSPHRQARRETINHRRAHRQQIHHQSLLPLQQQLHYQHFVPHHLGETVLLGRF
ncbi:hypothetical protein U9M48_042414 [Paspalum notatum var. saurae]|uniref:Uncharacterized protein n=1 Tax=Paspalum notatum var. saurae TaxID=547442 RepID=A0AAQ3XEG6_PASNO